MAIQQKSNLKVNILRVTCTNFALNQIGIWVSFCFVKFEFMKFTGGAFEHRIYYALHTKRGISYGMTR